MTLCYVLMTEKLTKSLTHKFKQWIIEQYFIIISSVGVIDSSGFEIIYTPKLRKHDAGNIMLGHDVWPTLVVPPQSKNFVVQGHCPTKCSNAVRKLKEYHLNNLCNL